MKGISYKCENYKIIPSYNILTNLKTFKLGKIKVLSLFLFYLYFCYIII